MTIYDIDVTLENGESYSLEKYKGHPLVIVNTATKCGLSGQFDELQKLYDTYHEQGLEVLGFPSDQFKQELSNGADAAEACRLSYGVTFPMHELVKLNGSEAHPLFQLLTSETKGVLGSKVKWNFTKFLVDGEGHVVKRFAPTASPTQMKEDIEKLL
ncbi:glutathione peroxidase [Kurthia senegalensis]|uniref:glutathione peroxidase n=1 Tax=Kurthia senegalensis TaxID=1033740 RepID=UPI000288AF44|nr:glutathione peroxidase [Kurthia senegalensis]